jgi:leucyl-tRNA synthetase
MTEYNFNQIEQKWQEKWQQEDTYKVTEDAAKPKYYVLDMFPYPSGAGLHVGHPLGYIASDIYSRYKVHKGFNVLHPMGFDAFGLPAEQYAIQTGQHPAVTTEKNIKRYKEQLEKIGFSYDWNREVITSDPKYYKWTQWTFIQLFNHYFNSKTQKAESIEELVSYFDKNGTAGLNAACTNELDLTAKEWKSKSEKEQQDILMNYRLAFQAETTVNWCSELGTVLANDEVKDGFSVRGGHPVEQKSMKQWLLRVSAYTERLLQGLDKLEWSDSLKEMQRNWIGKSTGAELDFETENKDIKLRVFTTRPDTLFGCTFMVLAPEHPDVLKLTTKENKEEIEKYIEETKKRTERDRLTDVKKITGQFTGSYAIHPFSGKKLPIWIADYVLIQYGTGAVMSVPAHDSRDYAFAKHFNIPITEVVSGGNIEKESYDAKEGKMVNSDFLNGLDVKDAIAKMTTAIEEKGIGIGKTNYRMRDAIFSRQRYWGEPFPIYYKDGIAYPLGEKDLPLELPEIDKFLPTETGEPPLARAKNWKTKDEHPLELDTMPGFAGSSAYYLRYMDPHNDEEYFSKNAVEYWQDVDLYIGGTEHATGHLIYARFWNKFLHDIGLSVVEEPFKKLVNQGMIQGRSSFVYRVNYEKYAEYLVWQQIKDKQLGVEFTKNYKEGRRQFDFYSKEAKVVLEIKSQKNIEKLSEAYIEYFEQNDYKILLIPIRDVLNDMDGVLEKVKGMIKGKTYESTTHIDYKNLKPCFVSKNIKDRKLFTSEIHVDVSLVENDTLDIEGFKNWRPEFMEADFILEDGKYVCGSAVEKMSKSLHNVVNPDEIIEKYGADTFRCYEMFLGPIEQHKPWNTDGIEGVSKFLKKFWNLFFDQNGLNISDEKPTDEEFKILHKTIKKIDEDINRLSFNTCVSTFMIAVNELATLKCNKKEILEKLLILLSPFAPHISEELWQAVGNQGSVTKMVFPKHDEKYLTESSYEYPVSVNGKLRVTHKLPINIKKEEAEQIVLELPVIQKWTEGKSIRKIIFVPNKIINIVVG